MTHVRACARTCYATSRSAFRKCTLIRLPSTFAAAAAVPAPIEPSNFRFLRQDSLCIRVYMFAIPTRKRAYIVYLPVMHTHIHTQAHARVRRLYVRIDRLVATAEPWSDFNFYVERENFTLCLRWPPTRPRRRTEGRVARKVNLLSRTCEVLRQENTPYEERPESSCATFGFVVHAEIGRISIRVHSSLVSRRMRGAERDTYLAAACAIARVTRGRVHMRSHAFHIR